MSGKPQIDGCRVVALGDAWAYGQGQITWNELEARAHAVPAEAQPGGCGEATCTVPWEPGCGLGKSEQHAEAQPVAYADPQAFANFKERGHLGGPHGREWMWAKPDAGLVPVYAHPPPSAPVGVEGLLERWRKESRRLYAEHLKSMALRPLGQSDAYDACHAELSALAQQPAACPHRERCECIGTCKHGMAGSGATEIAAAQQPAGSAPEGLDFHDRVELALRNAGFDYDDASRIASLAGQQGGEA